LNNIYSFFQMGMSVSLLACALVRAEEGLNNLGGIAPSTAILISSPLAAPVEAEPYKCPFTKCVVVSKFGSRAVPGKAAAERHEGVCLRAAPGQTVHAARSGKVIFAGFSKAYVSRADKRDQQRLIIVRHADGQSSRYVHLNTLQVRPPQEVQAGDALGTASESDEWTEPVLHFEIRAVNGTPLNPEKYLVAKR
jgi:murein DD-endopeptidase MepM/ murein hydrolase activator NlpD